MGSPVVPEVELIKKASSGPSGDPSADAVGPASIFSRSAPPSWANTSTGAENSARRAAARVAARVAEGVDGVAGEGGVFVGEGW